MERRLERYVAAETGHLIKEYYGDPRAWMRSFSGGPPRLARFNLDAINRR
jgi:hypothetical protein